jgi:cellulose synthase/poly-beta-1,6-N-acetylglucosamine synthase-like glycosyltransferase
MEPLFWLSVALVIYIYIGYPLVIAVLSKWHLPSLAQPQPLPSVSILIAAYNEEQEIGATLENKLALDYPRDKYEIIVVSDESTDATDRIVQQLAETADIPVKLIHQQPRQGKTAALNLAVPQANGDIIVFSDANSIYAGDALRRLVGNFSDPEVGYVTGKMVYTNPDGSLVGDGCSSYMKYENWMRGMESRLGSLVGVDGGIDAMRRSLYEPLAADQLPDFVQPLKVVEQGYRVVYEPRALLMEQALGDAAREYPMRVRVTLRALWALHDMRVLLNPFRFGIYAFQLFSHKLLRYLAFIPIILAFIVNALLLPEGAVFVVMFSGQLIFYLLALRGVFTASRPDNPFYVSLPYYFSLLNLACMHACWRYLRGEKQLLWTPRVG